ncbi:MAG: glycosyltransferase [Rickettsiales bacterium]
MTRLLNKLKEKVALLRGSDGTKRSPDYHIYELIWSIPEEYGGMTSAMLYRCFQFRRHGVGRSLSILTLQIDLDVMWAEKHIQSRWNIPKDVRVRNIWADLRAASDAELQKLAGGEPEYTEQAECRSGYKKTRAYTHEFKDPDGKVFRREHLRENGLLLLLVGVEGNRRTTILFDSNGRAIKQWPSTQELYLAWLDWAIERRPALLINEHRIISKFLYRAQFENVRVCQVVHGSHQLDPLTPYGELNSRADMVRNLASFDLVSILTEWQRQDLMALGVEGDNTRIMPNATKPSALSLATASLARAHGRGVVVAGLTSNKQIGHTLKALALVQKHSPSQLDIFGDGEDRQLLESLRNDLGLESLVNFRGYVAGAQDVLTEYSFLLFTSKSEGQGLVLLEAMARGCIPISYDMRYGPRDVITHGVDGFLLPPDDIDALAATLRQFLEMPEEKVLAMRRAAIKRAECFYPEQNMERWRTALNEVMSQPRRKPVKYGKGVRAVADNVVIQAGRCAISGRISGKHSDLALPSKVIVCTRKKASFLDLETEFETLSDTEKRFTATFELAHLPLRKVDYLDFHIRPVGALWGDKKRVGYGLELEQVEYPEGRVCRTKYGNLSLDCKAGF